MAVLIAVGILGSMVSASAPASGSQAHRARACSGLADAAPRDRSNPLALASSPGRNPLNGAHFFVNGPRHGMAAGAIAQLLGVDPAGFPANESWATFRRDLDSGPLSRRIKGHPNLAHKVSLLEKIAAQPETQRFSIYSNGGRAGAIADAVNNFFCGTATADPGSVPLITTYFLYEGGYCPPRRTILANKPAFMRRIDELASATGRHPAVFFLELDAIGSSGCMNSGQLAAWEDDLRYEIDKLAALPHTVVYVEGGYSDALSASQTADVLNAIGVRKIRGFFTNDTHFNWTISEIRWANAVSRRAHGAHFVINTADNGQGPKLNADPVRQGIEDLCNPAGRGLGPPPTTATGYRLADAFIWTGTPGRSAGQCHPGDAQPGLFGLNWALSLSSHANRRLGPHMRSRPY
jgi:endoglucanase